MKGLAVLAVAVWLTPVEAAAYCPCYTQSSPANSYDCGFEAQPGENPSVEEFEAYFELVAGGPTMWGDDGPTASDLATGCGGPSLPATFPCVLLKGIAAQESGWTQFCVPDEPADQVGQPSQTIISFDCGYGVGQVTSGMHAGETPGFDQNRVAGETLYNMATGARIFASKWNAASCVGTQDPEIVEHWYLAVWGYNGFAYSNNPNNPSYDSARGVWDPAVGGAVPYQERVFGWVEHPLSDRWIPTPLAYPDPAEIGEETFPGDLSEPACASPTDCTSMRAVTPASCAVEGEGGESSSGGADTGDATAATGEGEADADADAGEDTSGGGEASASLGDPSGTGTDGVTNGLPPNFGDSDTGCGCRHDGGPPWAGALFLLLLLRRRAALVLLASACGDSIAGRDGEGTTTAATDPSGTASSTTVSPSGSGEASSSGMVGSSDEGSSGSSGTTTTGGCVPAEEICDGLDNDCDEEIDEDVPGDGAGCQDPGPPDYPDVAGTIHITIETAVGDNANTDDPVEVCLSAAYCWNADIRDWNDREDGMRDVVLIEMANADRDAMDRFEVRTLDGTDRWTPVGFEVALDGEPVYCRDDLDIYIGNDVGELLSWTDPDGLDNHCETLWPGYLTHGAMVGAIDPDGVRIWYRTHATRRTLLRVAQSEAALADANVVDYGYPSAENDFAEVVHVVGLQPETDYVYDLEIEGERYGPWSFTTPPAVGEPWAWSFAAGSCAGDDDQPIFGPILADDPDMFLFLGDNHYANSSDLASLRQFYRFIAERPERQAMLAAVPVLAIWDDHDYVGNNADGTGPGRDRALRAFSEYWANAAYGTDETPGIFSRQAIADVEFFLLDDRYYRALEDSILGDAQEAWLFDALSDSDATFKLLVSGSQFTLGGTTDSWAVYPEAQTRLREHIADGGIGGVVFVSGDVHRSEFRLLPGANGSYDIPELTSSPLARGNAPCPVSTELLACEDVGDFFLGVQFDTTRADPTLTATIHDVSGTVLHTWVIARSDLQ